MKELDILMNQNLHTLVLRAALSGLLTGAWGMMAVTAYTLDTWRNAVINFGRQVLEPAQARAREKCRKEAGL